MNSNSLQQHKEAYSKLEKLMQRKLNKSERFNEEAYYIQLELLTYNKLITNLELSKIDSIEFESRYSDEIENEFDLEEYFKQMRFDKNHHLGLGDIRLTISQQVEIVNRLKGNKV